MLRKYINYINKRLFYFSPKLTKTEGIKRLGTYYGGYEICIKNLLNPLVISCGVGEDVSFDIDLINNFNAKIILVDPTPRAIVHYKSIRKNFGVYNRTRYNETGKLKPKDYNLKNVNSKKLILEKKAAWDMNNCIIKLFFPKNKEHVSLSVNKNHNTPKEFISVRTIVIKKIMDKYNFKKIDILKLDIEGSEIKVLNSILKNKIFPKQIIVEYDLRKNPSFA